MSTIGTEGRYERSDAKVRPLFLTGFVLAVLVVVSMAVSRWLSGAMTAEIRSSERANPVSDLLRPPDGPALQSVPGRELAEHRAWEQRMLEGTEWVDPVSKVVRIPIARGMELSLKEGFPVREEARTK